MSIKILGGIAKGFALKTPNEISFRPTSVMLKRKVFDCYQKLGGFIFIDLCSGSGAVGIEAWSRGAEKVFLIEENISNLIIINDNLNKLKKIYTDEIECRNIFVIKDKVERWLKNNLFNNKFLVNFKIDFKINNKIIFYFDPPYQQIPLYLKVIEIIKDFYSNSNSNSNSNSKSDIEFWIESDKKNGIVPEKLQELNLNIKKLFFQGSKFIAINTL
ncbi:MAG: RsmD family RNA methyltransferase [Oligoflexia bacterium]|nr:RsmD family RNA methyltransferase [Oligoflexia bacterium]